MHKLGSYNEGSFCCVGELARINVTDGSRVSFIPSAGASCATRAASSTWRGSTWAFVPKTCASIRWHLPAATYQAGISHARAGTAGSQDQARSSQERTTASPRPFVAYSAQRITANLEDS